MSNTKEKNIVNFENYAGRSHTADGRFTKTNIIYIIINRSETEHRVDTHINPPEK